MYLVASKDLIVDGAAAKYFTSLLGTTTNFCVSNLKMQVSLNNSAPVFHSNTTKDI